eukprot:15909_1
MARIVRNEDGSLDQLTAEDLIKATTSLLTEIREADFLKYVKSNAYDEQRERVEEWSLPTSVMEDSDEVSIDTLDESMAEYLTSTQAILSEDAHEAEKADDDATSVASTVNDENLSESKRKEHDKSENDDENDDTDKTPNDRVRLNKDLLTRFTKNYIGFGACEQLRADRSSFLQHFAALTKEFKAMFA